MMYYEKTKNAPSSLAIEKQKGSSGTYRCEDVLELLNKDFKRKCYLCETKSPTTLNIEHFKPHKGDRDLEYDWNNLFLSCGHCNNVKLSVKEYDDILDCTSIADAVEEKISYVYKPGDDVIIFALEDEPRTKATVQLLNKIYGGHTFLKREECTNINRLISREFHNLFDLILDYDDALGSAKERLLEKITLSLSRSSSYTAIKRAYISSSEKWKEFEQYYD